ncbi:hypothetical protein [Alicyclobacillus sp. SO9]|uniref:hypothetical protein n=1 Tax=Alicyclobacillus sp. SO9 TaxID=2665646 RepID=UPI0018E72679|nr:hypothetical protein [Alicyclobacillus sp. SO9]QQE80425.1 hypothetical protein GI364_08430 [Alicyclobacillus sp. SO9]
MAVKPKVLDKVPRVTTEQIEFGKKIGLQLEAHTSRVAEAMLNDLIDKEYYGATDLGTPTENQCNLASKFGYDISHSTERVGTAIIDDIMDQLNKESIDNQRLKSGDTVVNIWDNRQYQISSIAEDGTVYMKGGQGKKAWARSLRKR